MFDIFSMTNTILYSFIQRRKSASKPFQELIYKLARDLVPTRLRREKDEKKDVISDAVGAKFFLQQAFSQWDGSSMNLWEIILSLSNKHK